MSFVKRRSPLSSIENVQDVIHCEQIELRELNEPFLPTNDEESAQLQSVVDNEATPFSTAPIEVVGRLNDEFPTVDLEGIVQRRSSRQSSVSNRRNRRHISHPIRCIQGFFDDLFPNENHRAWILPIAVCIFFALMIIIILMFVVLGYTTIDYDEFGVTHNLITGILNLKNPYLTGVHIILPWQKMITFDKMSRYLNFTDLDIFTTDQASIILNATIVYRIRPAQIESIWLNFGDKHESILMRIAENVFRNYGNQFSIYDYRARREYVEYRLSREIQNTLSGDCCPICCHTQTCSKTIVKLCSTLKHCSKLSDKCSNGYFVDIDAVYIFEVELPEPVVKRLYTLMLKPIYTEIAESQETAAVVQIETERQKNEFFNKGREILMTAMANNDLVCQKAKALAERILFNQTISSQRHLFRRLNIEKITEKISAVFLLNFAHLANLTRTIDVENIVAEYENTAHEEKINNLLDFVPNSNVFDLSEFLSIIDN